MYEDDTYDGFEDDEFAEPIERIIRRLKSDSLLEEDDEGFWLGFQRAAKILRFFWVCIGAAIHYS